LYVLIFFVILVSKQLGVGNKNKVSCGKEENNGNIIYNQQRIRINITEAPSRTCYLNAVGVGGVIVE